jgi:SAM-dependent methyltransferase
MPSALHHPAVYDLAQSAVGYRLTARRLQAALAGTTGQSVLDVGAGTGNLARLLPNGASYIALEPDPAKRRQLSKKVPGAEVLARVGADTGLSDDSIDVAVCVAVSHHLDDEGLTGLIDEMARVARRFVFCDAVWDPRWPLGRVLWSIDRGGHPRTRAALMAAVERRFTLEQVSPYTAVHKYLLCVGRRTR